MPAPGVSPELSGPPWRLLRRTHCPKNRQASSPDKCVSICNWRAEQQNHRQAGSVSVEPRGHEKRHVRELLPASQPPVQALRPGQATFAQRLRSFVSGQGEPREHTAYAAWHPADESEPASPRYRPELSVALGAPLADEFASRAFGDALLHASHSSQDQPHMKIKPMLGDLALDGIEFVELLLRKPRLGRAQSTQPRRATGGRIWGSFLIRLS